MLRGAKRASSQGLAASAAASGLLLAAGCAGYHVGPAGGIPAGSRSVQIMPFLNKTMEPRLVDAISVAVREVVQEDGTYRLDTHGEGNIIVFGEVIRFNRSALAFLPNSSLSVQDFTLTMSAHVTAIERGTGRTNLNTTVVGQTVIRVGADQSSAEREAIPLLADDMARNLVAQLTEPWWDTPGTHSSGRAPRP